MEVLYEVLLYILKVRDFLHMIELEERGFFFHSFYFVSIEVRKFRALKFGMMALVMSHNPRCVCPSF